jgi:hypothetical protein
LNTVESFSKKRRCVFIARSRPGHPVFIAGKPACCADGYRHLFAVDPIALLDLSMIIYQAICFPIYKIPHVRRRDYLIFDRHHLAYLNIIEKINCAYCSYANGAISFAREVAARTEVYWCPIKHARRNPGTIPHYQGFADFGDAEGYRKQLDLMKDGVRIDGP